MCVKDVSPEKMIDGHIDDLLNGKYKLSVGRSDTYYLITTDKHLLMALNRSQYGYNPSQYNVDIYDIDQVRRIDQDQEVYKKLYEAVDSKYATRKTSYDPNKYYNMVDVKILVGTSKEITSGPGQRRFIEKLINNLIANRCPIEVIKRVFYCFDAVNSKKKKDFTPDFHILGHDNVLCEYKNGDKEMWRFVGDGYKQDFTPINEAAKQIFDKVNLALQNRRQK